MIEKIAAWSRKWTRAKVCVGINIEGHLSKRRRLSNLFGSQMEGVGGMHGRGRGWEDFLGRQEHSVVACSQTLPRR